MKAVNVDDVLKILYKYGRYIFVTDEKRYSSMVDEISNLKALEQEPCEDCVNRKDLDNALYEHFHDEDSQTNMTDVSLGAIRNFVRNFPSVTSQKPKTGHWIKIVVNRQHKIKCDKCDYIEDEYITHIRNYCPNCGIRMEEEE